MTYEELMTKAAGTTAVADARHWGLDETPTTTRSRAVRSGALSFFKYHIGDIKNDRSVYGKVSWAKRGVRLSGRYAKNQMQRAERRSVKHLIAYELEV